MELLCVVCGDPTSTRLPLCSDDCLWRAVLERRANVGRLVDRRDGQPVLSGEARRDLQARQGVLWSAILLWLQRARAGG